MNNPIDALKDKKIKTVLVLFLSLPLLAFTFGWALATKNPAQASAHPLHLPLSNHYQRIESFWAKKLSADSHSIIARTKLAEVKKSLARATGNEDYFADAELLIKEAIIKSPKSNPILEAKLASLIMSRHKFLEAYKLADKAYQTTNQAWILGVRGDAALGYGWYEKAFEDFSEYAKQEPGYASWVRLGHVLEILGRDKEALTLFKKARDNYKQNSPEPTAWIRLRIGIHHLNRGELNQAEKNFRDSLSVSPDYYLAQEHLAEIFELRGESEKAAKYLELAIETKRDPGLLARLASVKNELGKHQIARSLESEANTRVRIMASQSDAHLREQVLIFLEKEQLLERALKLARVDLEIRPEDLETNFIVAKAYRLNGKPKMAAKHLKKAMRYGSVKKKFLDEAQLIQKNLL